MFYFLLLSFSFYWTRVMEYQTESNPLRRIHSKIMQRRKFYLVSVSWLLEMSKGERVHRTAWAVAVPRRLQLQYVAYFLLYLSPRTESLIQKFLKKIVNIISKFDCIYAIIIIKRYFYHLFFIGPLCLWICCRKIKLHRNKYRPFQGPFWVSCVISVHWFGDWVFI